MNQNIDKKLEFIENLKIFWNRNKKKTIVIFILITAIPVVFFIWSENLNKKNLIISEKYISAVVALSSNEKDKAVKYYEEIIFSKNKFYSILALNTILEKQLVNDKEKIFKYFSTLEEIPFSEENLNLISLKKALYLMKLNNAEESKKILNELIKRKSSLKPIAEELIK